MTPPSKFRGLTQFGIGLALPDLPVLALNFTMESIPPLFHDEVILGRSLYVDTVTCTVHEVSPLPFIYTHHLHISQLQWPHNARPFWLGLLTSYKTSLYPTYLPPQTCTLFQSTISAHTVHLYERLQNTPISYNPHFLSHRICGSFTGSSNYPSWSFRTDSVFTSRP